VQSHSVYQHKASTLGTDVFLLDIVPPSPYNAADVVHTRSSSYDHRYTVADRDTVVGLPPPSLVRERDAATTLDNSAGPTLPARRPLTPQSPPPPPPSASNSLSYHSGVTNAAFTHPDPVRVDHTSTANSRRIVSVQRPSNGHHVSPSLTVYTAATSNGPSRSPAIPRRRDLDDDVDDGRRSATSAGGSRPLENEYLPIHPPPPPPAVSSAGTTVHQNNAVLVDVTLNRPAVLRVPLSLSAGELNFSPPAPHPTPNQVLCLLTTCQYQSQ